MGFLLCYSRKHSAEEDNIYYFKPRCPNNSPRKRKYTKNILHSHIPGSIAVTCGHY